MGSRCAALALWLCALFCAQAVRAEGVDFAVAPPWYQGNDGQAISARVTALVLEHLGPPPLVLPPKQTVTHVPKSQRVACGTGECVERYRQATGAKAVVLIRVFREADGDGPATSFQIGIQPRPGVEHIRGAVLGKQPLETSVSQVLSDVMADYQDGPGPFLHVRGSPEGADILVDEVLLAKVPARLKLEVGEHRVRVSAPGFLPMTRVVTLGAATLDETIAVRLEPSTGARAGEDEAARVEAENGPVAAERPSGTGKRSRRLAMGLLAGGGGAFALGATYAGFVIRDRVKAGSCTESADSLPCAELYRVNQHGTRRLAAGIAFLTASAITTTFGVVLLRRSHLRTDVTVAAGRASLALEGSF